MSNYYSINTCPRDEDYLHIKWEDVVTITIYVYIYTCSSNKDKRTIKYNSSEIFIKRLDK